MRMMLNESVNSTILDNLNDALLQLLRLRLLPPLLQGTHHGSRAEEQVRPVVLPDVAVLPGLHGHLAHLPTAPLRAAVAVRLPPSILHPQDLVVDGEPVRKPCAGWEVFSRGRSAGVGGAK